LTKKYFTKDLFFLKKIKFEHRKVIHFTLLACIILLQVVAIVIWFNESKLSKEFDAISTSNKILKYTNLVNSSLIQSQENFNNYINYKDELSLKKYGANLNEIGNMIDSLSYVSGGNKALKKVLNDKNKIEAHILVIKTSIDSIINKQIGSNPEEVSDLFKFKKLEFKKILDSIKTETSIKVDSVSKNGLFSRLGDALSGKYRIQKEQFNTVVTMKYKDKVTAGTIEEQIANVFLMNNRYYENEFNNLKNTFLNLRNNDLKLITLNNQILNLSQNLVVNYGNSANLLQNNGQINLIDQYKSNKIVRNYTIIILIVLMFIISIILLSFTRIAFEYEKRLTIARNQIQESLAFKNRIMGMISHEIRSPLNIISIYSKRIISTVKDMELKETFKSIQFTTDSLILLANQILIYSKEANYKPKLKNQNINLRKEIDQILFSLNPLLESKGNKMKVNSNIENDCEVYTDVAKIYQLFYNIIGNANKFTENGLISISTFIEVISEYEMNFKVEIKDNGIGIPKDDLKNLFESYYQGTISGKVNDLGVGLGLNLCKEIVELFDGEINVQSEVGKGTMVVFNLILTQN
jgi:two-component system, NarL family, sensor histidine kinase BarA